MSEHQFISEESIIHKNKDQTADFDIIIENQVSINLSLKENNFF